MERMKEVLIPWDLGRGYYLGKDRRCLLLIVHIIFHNNSTREHNLPLIYFNGHFLLSKAYFGQYFYKFHIIFISGYVILRVSYLAIIDYGF
jgi:hypothetical protein